MNVVEQALLMLESYQLEGYLLLGSCVLLVYGLIDKNQTRIRTAYGLLLVGALFMAHDQLSVLFVGTALALTAYRYTDDDYPVTYWFLLLTVLVGAFVMVKARNLLLFFVAIEMVSYSSYALTNFSFQKIAHEASIKYLLFGAVSAALMLFGISVLYGTRMDLGMTGLFAEDPRDVPYQSLGALMFLSGLLFKTGLVPFHLWIPNVYQSCTAGFASFLSVVPKVAGLVVLGEVMAAASPEWLRVVLLLGLVTLWLGTLAALIQTHARRMIAYGAVAHTGFMVPLVLQATVGQFYWYAMVYALMNVAVFYLLERYESGRIYDLKAYAGQGRSAINGVVFLILLLSLIGLPPLAGFTAKWLVFTVLWAQFGATGDPLLLAYFISAILATVLALIYYLKIPYQMFFQSVKNESVVVIRAALLPAVLVVLLMVLFFMPNLLF